MEGLLDLADSLAQSSPTPERPDFPLPEEYASISPPLELRETPTMGKGWVAAQDISAGTMIMVVKPIAMVMDWEDDSNGTDAMDDDEEEKEPRLNELLLLQILQLLEIDPNIWTDRLSTLFPRDERQLQSLPAWVCQDDEVFLQIESHLQKLRALPELSTHDVNQIGKRLPLIIRYNILSVETCSELLSYPSPMGHSNLSGVALYHWPSFFNHSRNPNCSRWAVGDVMGFYSNQDIPQGTPVCISYIEHDVLCESAFRRNLLLSMNFDDADGASNESSEPSPEEAEGPDLPVVDADVQNELMSMDPFERLNSIEELLLQATGAKAPTDAQDPAVESTGGMDVAAVASAWFQCDVQNLRILKAITLDGLGKTQEALKLWEECVAFVEQRLPPADESSVVLRTQAALCAFHLNDLERAQNHAYQALQIHNLAFGGGVVRFRRRYRYDLELQLRPTGSRKPVDVLWPM